MDFTKHFKIILQKVHSRTDFHVALTSLGNDQLSIILVATITTSAIKSLSDGVKVKFLMIFYQSKYPCYCNFRV